MEKPASLRAALVAAMPEFATDPDRLRLFVDRGRLVSRRTPGLGYEWRYTLRLEFHDFTRSPDVIAVPLLIWLREHQPERLLEFAREDSALGFAADILDDQTWDVAFAFELSEPVTVTPREKGGWDLCRVPEPVLDDDVLLAPGDPVPLREIWYRGERIVPE